MYCFFFQAEDGIRDLVRSRGLGDVYKRQGDDDMTQYLLSVWHAEDDEVYPDEATMQRAFTQVGICLLYTSDAADERSSVDLGGRRIINKKKRTTM